METDTTFESNVKETVVTTEDVSSLQGLETVTDESLMGVEETPSDTEAAAEVAAAEKVAAEKVAAEKADTDAAADKADADKADADKADADKADADKADADKAATDDGTKKDDKADFDTELAEALATVEGKAAEGKEEPTKPPKGFVPTAAVKEAREENRYLKTQIVDLQESVETLKAGKAIQPAKVEDTVQKFEDELMAEFGDFKVLKPSEFKVLVKDDPSEGMIYMNMLGAYNEAKGQVDTKRAEVAQQQEDSRDSIFSEANRLMEEYVPGIFDNKSGALDELVAFAKDVGFSSDLFYLTNPETQVILPGATEPVYLGTQAASVIKTLATAKNKAGSSVDESSLRETIRKEELIKLVEKLKSSKSGFRSLSQIAEAEADTSSARFGDKILSANEIVKLTPEEEMAYLQGL